MKQPKWITGIEVMEEYKLGYWVERGWDEVARVIATSVIDTVAADAAYQSNGQTIVARRRHRLRRRPRNIQGRGPRRPEAPGRRPC